MPLAIPKVFICSTAADLAEYRQAAIHACQRVGLQPLSMEQWPPDSRDAVEFCLGQVNKADSFLGILAHRYGYVPEGFEISITELEYERAAERGIPIHFFVIDADHPWPMSQVDHGSNYEKLVRFKDRIGARHTFRKLRDPQSFKEDLLVFLPQLAPKSVEDGGHSARSDALPSPPAMHSVPPYILTTSFVGRLDELNEIDDWARSADSVMVIDSIGGMGKSALAWEWTLNRARSAMPGLAGIVWWSFYETGSTMSSLVAEALAYITGTDPSETRQIQLPERARLLLIALRRRSYVLVLDGFERVLTAYHRLEPSKLRDDQVSDSRSCTDLRDTLFVRELVTCAPSKVLMSTRLMPSALENAAHQPIPGVRRKSLQGLRHEDGVELLQRLGVRGNVVAMRHFLSQFDNHGLLIAILSGRVLDYRPAPGDFDRWIADPQAGGGLRLAELDLKQRRTHILEYAFREMEPDRKALLSRIAAFSDAVDYQTLSILNPYVSPAPQEVRKPDALEEWLAEYQGRLVETEDRRSRQIMQERIVTETRLYEQQMAAYEAYVSYYRSPEYRAGVAAFDTALIDLENRGLVQWDRKGNSYDVHPVVRAYAFDQLEEPDRVQTYARISDHFERLPPEKSDEASDLSQLKNTIQVYRALIGSQRWERAWDRYRLSLSRPLLFSIASYTTIIELLAPFFPQGLGQPPTLRAVEDQAHVAADLGMAYSLAGRHTNALEVKRNAIGLSLAAGNHKLLASQIRNYAVDLRAMNHLAAAVRALEVARGFAEVSKDDVGMRMANYHLAAIHTYMGHFEEVPVQIEAFRKGEPLPRHVYRPGGAERYLCWSKFFQNALTFQDTAKVLRLATEERSVEVERSIYHLQAELTLQQGDALEAVGYAEQAMAIANKSGVPAAHHHGCLARALATQGLWERAKTTIEEALEPAFEGVLDRPYCDAAEVYLRIGDKNGAQRYALLAYKQAWAEGPPFVWWWWLERAKRVLATLGVAVPALPPFDRGRVEGIPNESAIRNLIQARPKPKKRS